MRPLAAVVDLVEVKQPKRSPIVTSVNAARALAAGITMLSLAGMTVYAGDHLHNQSAPLQPAAAVTTPPEAATTTSTTGRLRLSRGIPTTTTPSVTTTHHS